MASSMFFIPSGGGVTEEEVQEMLDAENLLRDNIVKSGNWMDSNTKMELHSTTDTGSEASSNSEAMCCYIKVGGPQTVDNVAIEITSGISNTRMKIALYSLTANYKPKTKLVETAEFLSTATGVIVTAIAPTVVQGWIAAALTCTSNSVGTRMWSGSAVHFKLGGDALNTFSSLVGVNGCKFTHVAGAAGSMNALPADAESAFVSILNAQVPRILLQVV